MQAITVYTANVRWFFGHFHFSKCVLRFAELEVTYLFEVNVNVT
jgi:hypothetical protein